jgi:hypothetical protein
LWLELVTGADAVPITAPTTVKTEVPHVLTRHVLLHPEVNQFIRGKSLLTPSGDLTVKVFYMEIDPEDEYQYYLPGVYHS